MHKILHAASKTICINYSPGILNGWKKNIFLQSFIALCLILFWTVPESAQITITASSITSFYSPGTIVTGVSDTLTKSLNIGSPGATSWNFSSLNADIKTTSTNMSPSSTPYASYFPNATFAEQVTIPGAGTEYVYYSLGSNLLFEGSYISATYQQGTASGTSTTWIKNVPDEITFHLPITFGTTWTSTFADSVISKTTITSPVQLPPITSVVLVNSVDQYTVDAYGSLTLPGGATYQALRLKVDRRSTVNSHTNHTISYLFITNNGVSVNVSPADTLQPNSGTININDVGWDSPTLTAVKSTDALPTGFILMQNYPNPFNPTTKIKFGLPENAFTTLKIYDMLGREVKTLVSAEMTTGFHEVEFNANDLSSGIYMYKLQSNNFTDVKKLILIK
jgi:hypothetical protein